MSRTARARRGLPSVTPGVAAPADRRFLRAGMRPARTRVWFATWRWAWRFVVVAALGLAVVAWLGYLLLRAPVLQVDRIVIHGQVRVPLSDLEARMADARGQSLAFVDLEAYRLRIVESPWVRRATIRRVLPATLDVRIVEREPLVVARLGGQLYLVDADGIIIDGFGPRYREFDLPIVDGLRAPGADGPAIDAARLSLVRRLWDDLGGRAELRQRVSQIDVSDPRNAVVLLAGEPARLHVGDTDFLARLGRYEEAASHAASEFGPIDYYDLRFDRLFVKPAGR
jgi:cell division septal protein FtsQ